VKAREYYELLLNPATRLEGKALLSLHTNQPWFDITSWMGKSPGDEAFTCLIPVIGAKLVGLNPRSLHGFDYVQAAKSWFDEKHGI
jgi:hypothetical protein